MQGQDSENRPRATALPSEAAFAVVGDPEPTSMSARTAILLVAAALIFSTGALFVREVDHPHPWTSVFWRSIFASVSLALLIVLRERSNALRAVERVGMPGLKVGAAFSAASIALVVALAHASSAVVLVIFALGPFAAALMAWAMLGERVHNHTWVAIGATVGGVVFMVSGSGANASILGVAIAFVMPISVGFGTVIIRKHSTIAMLPAMLLGAVISALVAAPFAHPLQVTRHDLVVLGLFGFAQLAVGLAIFSFAAPRAPVADVALISILEPIMGPIWVWIFVSEYPGMSALVGGAVVFVALAAHTIYPRLEVSRVGMRSSRPGDAAHFELVDE